MKHTYELVRYSKIFKLGQYRIFASKKFSTEINNHIKKTESKRNLEIYQQFNRD